MLPKPLLNLLVVLRLPSNFAKPSSNCLNSLRSKSHRKTRRTTLLSWFLKV
jgi:hypothetical protein